MQAALSSRPSASQIADGGDDGTCQSESLGLARALSPAAVPVDGPFRLSLHFSFWKVGVINACSPAATGKRNRPRPVVL